MNRGFLGNWTLILATLVVWAGGLGAQEGVPVAPAGPDALAKWLATPEKDRPQPTTKAEASDALRQVQDAAAALGTKLKDENLAEDVRKQLQELAPVLAAIEQQYTSLSQVIAQGEFSADPEILTRAFGTEKIAVDRLLATTSRQVEALRARADKPSDIPAEPSEDDLRQAKAAVDAATKTEQDARTRQATAATSLAAAEQRVAGLPEEINAAIDARAEIEKELAGLTATGYAVETREERLWLNTLKRASLERRLARDKAMLDTGLLKSKSDQEQALFDLATLTLSRAVDRLKAIEEGRERLERVRTAEAAQEAARQDPRAQALNTELEDQQAHQDRADDVAKRWADYFHLETGELLDLERAAAFQASQEALRQTELDAGSELDQLLRERSDNESRVARIERDRSEYTEALGASRRRLRSVEGRERSLAADVAEARSEAAGDQAAARRSNLRQKLIEGYEKEAKQLRALQAESEAGLDRLASLSGTLEKNRRAIEGRIRWTREESDIEMDSIRLALSDFRQSLKGLRAWPARFGAWLKGLFSEPSSRNRSLLAIFLIFLALLLFRFVQKRLPTTYAWLDQRDEDDGDGRTFRILGLILRRTNFSFFLALTFVGIPWACGLTREVIAVVAAVFATPFLYRLGRVVLDIVFAPDSPEGGLAPLDPILSRLFHRAGRYVLNLALVFVPIGVLMARFGYGARNPGFVELWWLVYKTLTFAIILFTVFRPAVLKRLIRGDGVLASSLKSWILLLYPVVVGVILFLVVLTSLRFETAERFFRNLFLVSGGLLLLAYLLYRVLLRGLVNVKDIDVVHNADTFADPEEYDNAQRRQFVDRTLRLGLRLVFLVPVCVLLTEFWDPVDLGFLDTGLWGEEPQVTLRDVLTAVLALVATVVVARLLRGLVNHVVARGFGWEQGLRYTAMTLTGYAVMTIGAIIFLNILQVKGSQIALVTSALVFGIGFGLQSIVKNFISGLILLIERPVRVGDRVEVGGNSGAVDKITLRATRVMTWEGVGIIIPNEELIGGTLINHSLGVPRLRTTLTFGVAYGSDLSLVRETVQKIVSGHGLVLKRPGPEVFFVGFGDSSLDFEVRFWSHLNTFRLRVASDMRYAIDAAFRKHEIEIPFPQRDVNLRMIKENGEAIDVPLPKDLPPHDAEDGDPT